MVHQIGIPNVIWWTHSVPLWAPVKSGARHYDDVYSLHYYVYDFTSFACVCIGGVCGLCLWFMFMVYGNGYMVLFGVVYGLFFCFFVSFFERSTVAGSLVL
jgi:hypothetical protein